MNYKHVISSLLLINLFLLSTVGNAGMSNKLEVQFRGWTPESFIDIFSRDTVLSDIDIYGTLYLPRQVSAQNPVPVVLLLHGSAGDPDRRRIRLARLLAENGIASLLVETFESRLLYPGQDYLDRLRRSFVVAQLADAFAALSYLKENPLINSNEITVAGFSMGGITAYLAANKHISDSLAPDDLRFLAHVSYYAPCVTRVDKSSTTGAPILMMIGELDESTPLNECQDLTRHLEEAGSPTQLKSLKSAPHGWDQKNEPRFVELPNAAPCSFMIEEDGTVVETSLDKRVTHVRDLVDLFEDCGSEGYTIGHHYDSMVRSDKILLKFLKQY